MKSSGNQGPARAPTPLSKAPPVASISAESATAYYKTRPAQVQTAPIPASPCTTQPGQHHRRRSARTAPLDFLSDKATTQLIRRVLYPKIVVEKGRTTPGPIEEVLPPLTSRNDVDLQLYALFAIVLREYVQSWYAKITSDETFAAEIVQIIAHCTRALEQRLRKVDLASLMLDELPDLLDRHVSAYRSAHNHNPMTRPPVPTVPHDIYHALCPLPALSPVPQPESPATVAQQAENETSYRQLLVQGVLAILLPTEDLENACLTALIGQLLSELVIGSLLVNNLSEPWLIWECLSLVFNTLHGKKHSTPSDASQSNLEAQAPRRHAGLSLQQLFWSVVHWVFLTTALVKMAFSTAAISWTLPRRATNQSDKAKDGMHDQHSRADAAEKVLHELAGPARAPVVSYRWLPALGNWLEMDTRMPWLCGALSMLQWLALTGPGRIAGVDGILDRLLSHIIHTHFLPATMLAPVLRTVRANVFPNNAPSTAPGLRPPANEAELGALRRRCAASLKALLPKVVAVIYFGGGWDQLGQGDEDCILDEIEATVLDVFSDSYANKHLLYGALELVLVRLMPELAERGVGELWEERLA